MKPIIYFCSLFLFVLGSSCSKSSDPINSCNNTSYTQEFQDELNAVTAASSAYANDPTNSEKCENFKSAYIDYIDALEDWEECAVWHNQEVEWRQALDGARQSAEDIEC